MMLDSGRAGLSRIRQLQAWGEGRRVSVYTGSTFGSDPDMALASRTRSGMSVTSTTASTDTGLMTPRSPHAAKRRADAAMNASA